LTKKTAFYVQQLTAALTKHN